LAVHAGLLAAESGDRKGTTPTPDTLPYQRIVLGLDTENHYVSLTPTVDSCQHWCDYVCSSNRPPSVVCRRLAAARVATPLPCCAIIVLLNIIWL